MVLRLDFSSVVHAVQCAQQVHAHLRAHNAEKESTEQIHVRIGIHLGDIVQQDGDVFGDGVNIASRLQALADPDSICISDMVYRDVAKKLDLGMAVSLGRPKLKNIAERFAVYALLSEPPQGVPPLLAASDLPVSEAGALSPLGAAGVSVLAAGAAAPLLLPPRKSVAYQPVPLSWKPAAVTCFANCSAPQAGHCVSGESDSFCSTSREWPQAAQR